MNGERLDGSTERFDRGFDGEPFGSEPFGLELRVERLRAELLSRTAQTSAELSRMPRPGRVEGHVEVLAEVHEP